MTAADVTGSSPGLPVYSGANGLQTEFGLHLPPGGRVAAYVRSTDYADYDSFNMEGMRVQTLAAALSKCRAGKGDIIIVLPGHTEDVDDATMLDNLVAGTKILGVGHGSNAPTFTWTATGSQWTLDQDDVVVAGLNLQLNGANGITKSIIITGANTVIERCEIDIGTGASNHSAIAIEFSTGADGAALQNCLIKGTTAGAVTNAVLVAAAVDGAFIGHNRIRCATGAVSTGPINVTAAATNLDIKDNDITNNLASSETGISVANVAATGIISDNYISTEAGDPKSDAIEIGASALFRMYENYATDTANTSGQLAVGSVSDIPVLLHVSPADGATSVAVGANLVMNFDRAVAAGSGNFTTYETGVGAKHTIAIGDAQVTFDGSQVTVNPSTDLDAATAYHILIDSGAIVDAETGVAYAGIADATTWNLTTA